MAITQQTSGTLSVSGTLPVLNPGWHTWTSGSTPYAIEVHFDHPDSHYTQVVSLGAASVRLEAVSARYEWDTVRLQWNEVGGMGSSIPGYPAAFSNPPNTAKPYKAVARGFKVTRTVGSTVDVEWIALNWSYWILDALVLTLANTGGSSFDLQYAIEWDPIPLAQAVVEETTPARTHATCVHQLRDQYSWVGDVPVSVTCVNTTDDTISYNSPSLPQATFQMSWGEGGKWDHTTPPPPFPLKHYYERYSEAWTLSYGLSDQYGAGFRASGSEDKAGHETHATYTFGNGYMTGTVTGNTAQDEEYAGGPWTENEFIQASTSIGIDLVACDQMTTLTSGAGLKAYATHFIDQTMDWDAGNQKYVQSVTYSDPLELDVPGSYSMSFQKTSRYEDRLVPNSADDVIRVELTSASLGALDLPIADHVMTLHDRALDAIGIDTADWGDHDEHGGPYYGLLLIWVQSPLSVQWAQDDRGEAAPPSWWYDTVTTIPLTRQATIQAVASFGGGEAHAIKRDLAWHPTRRVAGWLGEIDPGVAEADLWKHVGDWQRLSATKHLLAGTIIGGPYDMTSGNVTCDEEDPVDHTAYGEMPWSEDVTDWRLYKTLRFVISSDKTEAWTLHVRLNYEYDTVTDNYMMATKDRRDGFLCQTHNGTAVYTVNVPGSAASANCDIDLIGANAPYLERVTSITLSGLPGGYDETVIEDVQLIAPTAGVWVESTDQRPVSSGGEPRYTCGSLPEFLGVAKTPEEYGGFWAMGGHTIARGVRDPGRSVDVAPNWGMPFVIRRNSDCGALQDELMDFSAWHGQRVGDWGLEGLYGQLHNEITDAAMSDWVDGDDTPLGLATGAGWITHVPILLQFPIGSQDLLSAGRDQDGATDIPVIVRAGCLRPAQGLNWAHSGAGTAPDFGFKIILYGARLDVATSGTAPVGRAGNGLTYTLYEHPSTGSDRLVTTAVTDADSRLRFAKGVNEFRHVEYGSDAMTDPDWLNRYDYLSDVLAPGETTGDLEFGLPHYQVIPTWLLQPLEAIASEYDWDIDQAGRIWAAYIDGYGDVRVVWADQLPLAPAWRDAGTPLSGATDWTCPSIVADTDAGRVLVCATSAAATSFSHGTRCSGEGAVTMEWSEVSSDMAQIGDSLTLCDIAYRQGVTALAGYSGGTVYFERSSRDDLSRDELTAGVYQIEVAAAAEERPAVAIGDDGSYLVAVRVGAGIQRYRCAEFSAGFELVDEVTA